MREFLLRYFDLAFNQFGLLETTLGCEFIMLIAQRGINNEKLGLL